MSQMTDEKISTMFHEALEENPEKAFAMLKAMLIIPSVSAFVNENADTMGNRITLDISKGELFIIASSLISTLGKLTGDRFLESDGYMYMTPLTGNMNVAVRLVNLVNNLGFPYVDVVSKVVSAATSVEHVYNEAKNEAMSQCPE